MYTYVGARTMENRKLTQWSKEPLMQCSYITTACLGSDSTSATRLHASNPNSDFSLGRFIDIADDESAETEHEKQSVNVDSIRILRGVMSIPLRRIWNAKFKAIHSAHMRAVLRQDIY